MPVIHSPQQSRSTGSGVGYLKPSYYPPPPPPPCFEDDQENPPAQFKPKTKPLQTRMMDSGNGSMPTQDNPFTVASSRPPTTTNFPPVTVFADSTTNKLLEQQKALAKLNEQHDTLKRKSQNELQTSQDRFERERAIWQDTTEQLKRTHAEQTRAKEQTIAELTNQLASQASAHQEQILRLQRETLQQAETVAQLKQAKHAQETQHHSTVASLRETMDAAKQAQHDLHCKQMASMKQDFELEQTKLRTRLESQMEFALKEQRSTHFQQVETLQRDLAQQLAAHDALVEKLSKLVEQHETMHNTLQRERKENEIQLSQMELQIQHERASKERELQEKQLELEIATQRTDSALARALNIVKRTEEKLMLQQEEYAVVPRRRRSVERTRTSSLADLDFEYNDEEDAWERASQRSNSSNVSRRRNNLLLEDVPSHRGTATLVHRPSMQLKRRNSITFEDEVPQQRRTSRRNSLNSILDEMQDMERLVAAAPKKSLLRNDPFLVQTARPSKNYLSPTSSSTAKQQVRY